MASPLRVGIIGVGGIAQMMHLPHLFERPDKFEIKSLADVSAKTLEVVGKKFHVGHLTSDFRETCTHKDVDAVMVFASGSHYAPAMAALEAGKHLLVEKPLSFSLKETEAIAAAAKKSKGKLMVGYHKRFDPAYLRARDAVKAMKDLRYVEVTVLHPDDGAYRTHHPILPDLDKAWSPTPEAVGDKQTVEAATKGPLAPAFEEYVGKDANDDQRTATLILLQSLIHDLNAVRGVLGEPEEVISAHAWRLGLAQSSITRFSKDVRVNMSWISVPGLKNYSEVLKFVGTNSRVTLTFPSPYLRNLPTPLSIEHMVGDDLVVESRTVSYDEAFRNELLAFHESVVNGKKLELTEDEALGDARWVKMLAEALRN